MPSNFIFPIPSYAMYYENLLRHQHQLLYMKEQVRQPWVAFGQF